MKKIIKICALAVVFSMLLGGCGESNTGADEKASSLKQEQEKEKSKNAKEEKQEEQSSKTTESREASSGSASSEESQSSQSPVGDLFGKKSNYADVNVGDTIKFGHYEQDNDTTNGAEEIEWLVLAKEDDRILVISQYALDATPYDKRGDVTWEVCWLRSWLNDSFYNKAFNGEEQAKILTVTNSNPDSYGFYNSDYAVKLHHGVNYYKEHGYGANGGNATSDNVFCLSYEEALAYFASDEARRCTPTAYAIEQGIVKREYDNSIRWPWWLRSPGRYQDMALHVSIDGSLNDVGELHYRNGLRPALWISTK